MSDWNWKNKHYCSRKKWIVKESNNERERRRGFVDARKKNWLVANRKIRKENNLSWEWGSSSKKKPKHSASRGSRNRRKSSKKWWISKSVKEFNRSLIWAKSENVKKKSSLPKDSNLYEKKRYYRDSETTICRVARSKTKRNNRFGVWMTSTNRPANNGTKTRWSGSKLKREPNSQNCNLTHLSPLIMSNLCPHVPNQSRIAIKVQETHLRRSLLITMNFSIKETARPMSPLRRNFKTLC